MINTERELIITIWDLLMFQFVILWINTLLLCLVMHIYFEIDFPNSIALWFFVYVFITNLLFYTIPYFNL